MSGTSENALRRSRLGPKNGARFQQSEYEYQRLLKESLWLRTIAHLSPVGIFHADAAGRCTYVNERWSEMTGLPASAVLGVRWELGIHPDDVATIGEAWQARGSAKGSFRIEYRYLQPSGRVVWALAQIAAELDGRGREIGYICTITDVSELHAMREELQRANADLEARMDQRAAELRQMAMIVEVSDDAIVCSDRGGRIQMWNSGAERTFGYTAAEMIGQTTLVLTPANLRDAAQGLRDRAHAGETIHHHETVRQARNGDLLDVSISVFPQRNSAGEMIGTCGIVRDITALKRAERRLRQLSWSLLRLQDEERRRLARELHDSTAQTVAAVAMNLAALTRSDSAMTEARRQQLLAECLQMAESATGELRTAAYLLHPPLLDERGLAAAVRWYVDGFASRSGVRVRVEVPPEMGRLSPEAEMALFRVVQESLLNVHRHSGSKTASVRLHEEGEEVILEIRDAGHGLRVDEREAAGVGIPGMRERLLQLGGSLLIESNHPGAAVIARVPRNA